MKNNRPPFPGKAVFIAFAYILTVFVLVATVIFKPVAFNTYKPLRLLVVFFASILLAKYFFYMIISPLHTVSNNFNKYYWKKRMPRYRPKVSVIIPAWNEEIGILTTVKSVLLNDYNNMEVIIINDGSTDRSDAVIKEFVKKYNAKKKKKDSNKSIVYKYKKNEGKGSALNQAISISSGEIIISIDADCRVDSKAIKNFVQHFRNPNVSAAVGNVKIGNTKSLLGLIQYLEFTFSFYFKKADSFMGTIYIIGGAAGAFRKEIFNELGNYNTTNITEDIELTMRIQDAGKKIVYASDSVVFTEGASDISGLKNQRLRWKRGRFQTFYSYWYMFGSLKKRHNKFLSWLVLPLALFSEIQLAFEIPFIGFLFIYSLFSKDYSSFISGIIVVSSMFFFLLAFEDKNIRRFSFFALAPIAWFLFYVMTYVEASSLKNSIQTLLKGQNVGWQKWDRKGVVN